MVIAEICDFVGLSNEEKIVSITMLLLNENCNTIYINNIYRDYNTLSTTATIGLDANVLLLGKLMLEYFQNPNTFNPNLTSNEGKLYKLYNKPGKKPIYVLINIFIDLYDKMFNKPLKQTILDFIYLIVTYDQQIAKNINIFKQMSSKEIAIPAVSLNFEKNIQPSHYGLENVLLDASKFSYLPNLVENHFRIAHIFGLYFEGMCNPHQNYSLDNSFYFPEKTKKQIEYKEVHIAVTNPGTIPGRAILHTFNPIKDRKSVV